MVFVRVGERRDKDAVESSTDMGIVSIIIIAAAAVINGCVLN